MKGTTWRLIPPFVQFLRSGGKSEYTVSLHRLNRAPERKHESFDLFPHLQRFLGLVDDADEDNITFISERLRDTPRYDAGPLKQRAYDKFDNRLSAVLTYYLDEDRDRAEIASLMETDIRATETWLLRQFRNDVNEAR